MVWNKLNITFYVFPVLAEAEALFVVSFVEILFINKLYSGTHVAFSWGSSNQKRFKNLVSDEFFFKSYWLRNSCSFG